MPWMNKGRRTGGDSAELPVCGAVVEVCARKKQACTNFAVDAGLQAPGTRFKEATAFASWDGKQTSLPAAGHRCSLRYLGRPPAGI